MSRQALLLVSPLSVVELISPSNSDEISRTIPRILENHYSHRHVLLINLNKFKKNKYNIKILASIYTIHYILLRYLDIFNFLSNRSITIETRTPYHIIKINYTRTPTTIALVSLVKPSLTLSPSPPLLQRTTSRDKTNTDRTEAVWGYKSWGEGIKFTETQPRRKKS